MNLIKNNTTMINQKEFALDAANSGSWDKDQKASYLDYITRAFKEAGVDIASLGIEGYSNNTDLSELKKAPEKVDEIVKQLMEIQQN
jgi:hypothetical protein